MSNTAPTLYARDDNFWENYRKGRPNYPDSLFERIYQYHAQNGSQFDIVHDTGAGGGVHSARLAERFRKVMVSDPAASNIEAAKSNLHGPKYEFRVASMEETNELPAGSINMVYGASMLHFTETAKAFEAAAHQLKSGGTLAVVAAGLPVPSDPNVYRALKRLVHSGFEQQLVKHGDRLRQAIEINASGYDSIALPGTYFHPESIRLKLNEPRVEQRGYGTWYDLMIPEKRRVEFPPVSNISKSEKVLYETDDDWLIEQDVTSMRNLCESLPFDLETDEMKDAWNILASAIGDRKVESRWVVCLILATRK